MKFLELLMCGGLVALIAKGVQKQEQENERKARENEQRIQEYERRIQENEDRKNTPIIYDNGITKVRFESAAYRSVAKIRRKGISIHVEDAVIYGTVESQSGLSTWHFTLDFNDYGTITGTCWSHSENDDSLIPNKVMENMQEEIERYIG